ncbi:isoprenylcysteine carboxylmethyltransferase family protein [Brevundimonas sp.]|uniref:methyltransferase family protein n=1 Tax=Brevundimonas sp. TaxID=1871086 RepID=UPI0035B2DC11
MAGRDHPGVIAPPPLIYFAFLLAGWGLLRLGQSPVGVDAGLGWLAWGFGLETQVRRGVAIVLIVGGLLLDGAAAGYFRRIGTAVEPWKPSTALATKGLYGLSRNPIYLGFAITYLGLSIAMNSVAAAFLLVPCLWVVDRFVIRREERYLAAKFGAEYEAYRARVRRWL